MNKIVALKSFILAVAGLVIIRITGTWKKGKPQDSVTLSGAITKEAWSEAKDCALNEDCGIQVTLDKKATSEQVNKVREQFTLLASAYGQGVDESVWNERVQFKFIRASVTVDESILEV